MQTQSDVARILWWDSAEQVGALLIPGQRAPINFNLSAIHNESRLLIKEDSYVYFDFTRVKRKIRKGSIRIVPGTNGVLETLTHQVLTI